MCVHLSLSLTSLSFLLSLPICLTRMQDELRYLVFVAAVFEFLYFFIFLFSKTVTDSFRWLIEVCSLVTATDLPYNCSWQSVCNDSRFNVLIVVDMACNKLRLITGWIAMVSAPTHWRGQTASHQPRLPTLEVIYTAGNPNGDSTCWKWFTLFASDGDLWFW